MKFLLGIALALGISAAAYAAAATINLNGGVIQAGEDLSLTCDDEISVVGWGLESDTGAVTFVRIGDIDAACFGSDMFVSITGVGGEIASGSVQPIDSATEVVNFSAVQAADITDIHIFLEGPDAP